MQDSTSDIQSLAARIEKLEKQNRWFLRGACTGLLLFASAFIMGQAKPLPDVIEAHSFVVRDLTGKKAAELSYQGDQTWLRIYDLKGKTQTTITGGFIRLDDPPNSLSHVRLGFDNENERPQVHVHDKGFGATLSVKGITLATQPSP